MQKKFGIIGYGRFGQLWAKTLANFGEVLVFDTKFFDKKNIPEAESGIRFVSMSEAAQTDILFLAVPVADFEKLCKGLSSQLSSQTIVVDTCAVKVYPAKIMTDALLKSQPYAATHPLFGPDSVARLGLAGCKLVFCPLNLTDTQRTELLNLFVELKLVVIETTPDDHDRQMARSQALVHFFGRALADLHLESQEISTPDYESLLRINSLVNNDTWQLFFDMQTYNPYTPFMRLILRQSLADLDEKIRQAGENKTPDEGSFFLWRSMIDQLDHEIINLIAHRLKVGKRIQGYKKLHGMAVTDPERERELKKNYDLWIREAGIEKAEAVKQILQKIIHEVKN